MGGQGAFAGGDEGIHKNIALEPGRLLSGFWILATTIHVLIVLMLMCVLLKTRIEYFSRNCICFSYFLLSLVFQGRD